MSPEFAATNNLGEQATQSGGYSPIFTHDAGMLWLCPTCFDRAHKLALEILSIVKDEHFYFPNLLDRRK